MISPRYLFFGVAVLSTMMFSIDGTIVAVALPTLMRELNTSIVMVGWTLTAYQLAQTVMMPLAGKLSDTFGRTRVFAICVGIFLLGSLLCGIAPNVYFLILFRIVQAIGGGGLMPSAVGVIADEFPETRPRMIGLFMSTFPIGGIIGPNLGGFIIEHASWREVFLINVPLGLIVLATLVRRMKRGEATDRRPVDLIGVGLFAVSIVALLLGLTLLGQDVAYFGSVEFWALIAVSVVVLGVFVWHERRTSDPVIDPELVARHPFLAVNAYNFLSGACVWGFFSFIPYYAALRFGFGPLESGAVLTPRSLAMMGTATISSFMLMRYGYRLPMLLGCLFTVATLLLLGRGYSSLDLFGLHVDTFWLLAGQVAIGGIGMGLGGPASNNAALDLVPGRAATVSGIRSFFRSTGGVLGTASIVLALELSPDKAAGLQTVFTVLGFGLLATLPLVFVIPDTARERVLAARRGAAATARV
jgi:EmrB/QacA subfamily drug resistance transporter